MLIQALLVGIWAGLCTLDQWGPHLGFRKPLLAGFVTGIILGNPFYGLIIGGTLELLWLGVNNVGAYIPPDVITGSVVGVSIGILSGFTDVKEATAAGIAVAIPISLIVQQVAMLVQTSNISLVHRADIVAEEGDWKKIDRLQYLGMFFQFISRFLVVFFVVYLGAQFVESVMKNIPKIIFDGLGVSSKIIPAVGLAMLLTMMMRKHMWIFLILGFVMSAYLKLPLIGLALFGLVFAGIYDLIVSNNNEENVNVSEEEYDL